MTTIHHPRRLIAFRYQYIVVPARLPDWILDTAWSGLHAHDAQSLSSGEL